MPDEGLDQPIDDDAQTPQEEAPAPAKSDKKDEQNQLEKAAADRARKAVEKFVTEKLGTTVGTALGGPLGAAAGWLAGKLAAKALPFVKKFIIWFVVGAVLLIVLIFAVAGLAPTPVKQTGATLHDPASAQDIQNDLPALLAFSGSSAGKQHYFENNVKTLASFIEAAYQKNKDEKLKIILDNIKLALTVIKNPDASPDIKQQKYQEIKNGFIEAANLYPEIFKIPGGVPGEILKTTLAYIASPASYNYLCDCKKFVNEVIRAATKGKTVLAGLANDVYQDMKNGKYPNWQFIDLAAEKPQPGDILMCYNPGKKPNGDDRDGHVAIYWGGGKTAEASIGKPPKPPHFWEITGKASCESNPNGYRFQAAARYKL